MLVWNDKLRFIRELCGYMKAGTVSFRPEGVLQFAKSSDYQGVCLFMCDASSACSVFSSLLPPFHHLMYSVTVVLVFCLLVAQSAGVTCQMADDASGDVSVASVLAYLTDVPAKGEDAAKLYKLAEALQGKPSRERRDLLQKLCPSWNICLRAGGKKETNHAVEQELRSAATRAYLALRARETAAPYGAGADGFAHLSGTEATQSIATERVAADGEATERASHCKDHPAVLPTVHGAQSSSAHGKRQAEKHDDLPQNKKSVLHLLQGGSGVCELRRKCVARQRKRCRTEAGRPACCSRAPSSQEAVGL